MSMMQKPAFTAPSVQVWTEPMLAHTHARVHIYGDQIRLYTALDGTEPMAVTRALEQALHAEYARLEQQRALVRELRRLWKAAKASVVA